MTTSPPQLLVLGGGSFVGAAIVDDAVRRGWRVTCLTRGLAPLAPGIDSLVANREDARAVASALTDVVPDYVIDTWAGAPSVVARTAEALAHTDARVGYISTRSVYAGLPDGADELTPTVDADPDAPARSYAEDKRGGELAWERAVGPDRVAHFRPGAIVGPRDNHGRLPWWLARLSRGGPTLAPGPRDAALQYVDVRDLAAFALSSLERGASGAFDTVTPPSLVSMGDLLETARSASGDVAELVWMDARWLLDHGAEPWREVPFWAPAGTPFAGVHSSDPSKAIAAGLAFRPLAETVADTWASMQDGSTPFGAVAAGLGMAWEKESELLRLYVP